MLAQYHSAVQHMVTVPAEHQAALEALQAKFLEINSQINLSALRTPEQCWPGNVLDSLAALDLLPATETATLLDIGTGSGFPLLPIAIVRPHFHCTGLDSVGKKMKALAEIAAVIGLKNVTLLTDRSEVLGHAKRYREQFDFVTARAVAPLPTLLEFCSPFVKPGGRLLLWKSLDIAEELATSARAQLELRCKPLDSHRYVLPGDWGERQILVFSKTAPLPKMYPRATGVPKKEPLL